MTLDDYEAVYRLWLSCKGMGLNNLDDSREGIGRFLDRNPQTCYVATSGSDIVGVIHDAKRAALRRSVQTDGDPQIEMADLEQALKTIPPSVTERMLAQYERFRQQRFG